MIQTCDPPRTLGLRRLSAQEFCTLLQKETSSIYRPHSEVLRMVTVGEVWGLCAPSRQLLAAQPVLPMDADLALAAALRACRGWRGIEGGYFLAPPGGAQDPAQLVAATAARARQLARGRQVLAVLDPGAQQLLPLYLGQGFALRALRPLNSLAPCFVLAAGTATPRREPVWVPLEDRMQLARQLAKGYAALDSRRRDQSIWLGMYPV